MRSVRNANEFQGEATMSDTSQDHDRRADRRRRTLFGATIILDSRVSTFDVTVRNRSGEGFLLDAGNTTMIPNEFSLRLPEETVEYRCIVIFRTSGCLGVKVIGRVSPSSRNVRASANTVPKPQLDQQAELRSTLAVRFPHLVKPKR